MNWFTSKLFFATNVTGPNQTPKEVFPYRLPEEWNLMGYPEMVKHSKLCLG